MNPLPQSHRQCASNIVLFVHPLKQCCIQHRDAATLWLRRSTFAADTGRPRVLALEAAFALPAFVL
jgi:hypothetical protein